MTEKKDIVVKRKKHAKRSNKKKTLRSQKTKTKDGRTITQTVRININTASKKKSKRRKKRAPRQMRELSDIPQPIRKSNQLFNRPLAYDTVRGNSLNETSRLLLANSPQGTTAEQVKQQLLLDRVGMSPSSPLFLSEEDFKNKYETDETFKRKAIKDTLRITKGTPAGKFIRNRLMGKRESPDDDDGLITTKVLSFEGEEKEYIDDDETPNESRLSRFKKRLTPKKKKTKETKENREVRDLKKNAKSMGKDKEPNRQIKLPEKYL